MSSHNRKYWIPALAIGGACALGTAYYLLSRPKQQTIISEVDHLNKELCQRRRGSISSKHVEYDLLLVFPAGEDHYYGEVEIKFELAEAEEITVDFQKKGIAMLAINRKIITDPKGLLSNDQIVLPKQFLKQGENLVQIKLRNSYDKNKYGLIKEEDGTIHAVTCGYLSSLIFPCFDQPNIKGTIKLRAIAPKNLKVIANEKVSAEGPISDSEYIDQSQFGNYKIVEFLRTKILPIHNFTIYVGAFEAFKARRNWKAIPITFYCRPSVREALAESLPNLEIVVTKTLDFFFSQLNSKYPFSKLDIVYTDSPAPAIEYPGAILMSEEFLLSKDLFTSTENLVILCHEIVHMWFGNITTCDYWDSLFIHESFANYVSYLIYQSFYKDLQGTFQEPNQYFLLNKTKSAPIATSLGCSRSIKSDINEIELANTAFDSIVYNKGEFWLSYFHDSWKDNFYQLLTRMTHAEQWNNLGYGGFLAMLPELERGKVKLAFESKGLDVFEINKGLSPNKYVIRRVSSTGLSFEQISIAFFNTASNETKVVKVNISINETEFEAPSEMADYFYVFNQNSKALCIWKDENSNVENLIANIDKLSDNDVLHVLMNQLNYHTIKSDEPTNIVSLFKAAYPVVKRSTANNIIKKLYKLVVLKAKDGQRSDEIFQFLIGHHEATHAINFITSEAQATQFNQYIKDNLFENEEFWRKFVCLTHKLELKSLYEQTLNHFNQYFKDDKLTDNINRCSDENIDNEFLSVIMYRTGNKNLKYYRNLASFIAIYTPDRKRVELALKFLRDFQSVSKQVSKFYIQGILGKVLPKQRTNQWNELREELVRAIGQVSTQPFLSTILTKQAQKLSLFND